MQNKLNDKNRTILSDQHKVYSVKLCLFKVSERIFFSQVLSSQVRSFFAGYQEQPLVTTHSGVHMCRFWSRSPVRRRTHEGRGGVKPLPWQYSSKGLPTSHSRNKPYKCIKLLIAHTTFDTTFVLYVDLSASNQSWFFVCVEPTLVRKSTDVSDSSPFQSLPSMEPHMYSKYPDPNS